MDMKEITGLDAGALSAAIHERRVSCREVMRGYLDCIAALNPRYNAIVSLRDEGALLLKADERDAQLARGQSLGWMHGVPQAVKDPVNVAGIPTTLGSPLMRNFMPQADALMAQRLKAAGAIIIGKTNTPEFGLGSHTFNEVFGVTRNAYDAARSAACRRASMHARCSRLDRQAARRRRRAAARACLRAGGARGACAPAHILRIGPAPGPAASSGTPPPASAPGRCCRAPPHT
jgi:hypothetical protein